LPVIGNFHQLDRPRIHELLARWSDEFGPIYKFSLMSRKFVAFTGLEHILSALRDRPVTYRRIGTVETVFAELGAHGLFSAEGEEWRRQRALTQSAFNSHHLHGFYPTLLKVTERLAHRWQQAADESRDVEVQKDLMRFTVDVTTNLAFGYDMNTLEQGENAIQKHLERIFPTLARRITAPFPYWRYVKLPSDCAVDESLHEIKKSLLGFIEGARQRLKENPALREKPTNFLEGLLVGSANISDEDLIGNLLTILLAGEDTTANAAAWMMYLIAEHPEVQEKLREEADRVLGSALLPTDYAQTGTLPYAEAVAMEALRFRPVAAFLFLQANKDTELGGVAIPKDMLVALLLGHCGMQEENFTDAKKFSPERWIHPPKNHNPKAMLVFGEGPRFCPGRTLAIVEMKTIAAMVARRFKLSKPRNGIEPRGIYEFVIAAHDLWVRLDPR